LRLRVTAKGGYSNERRGIDAKFGETLTVDDALAAKLIHHRLAEPAPEPKRAPVVETAAVEPPANTAKRTYKPKPRTRKGPQ